MIIYDKKGIQIIDAPVTKQAKRNWQLMTNNYVQLSFELSNFVAIPKGSYIECLGERFYMIRSFAPDDLSSKDGYKYEPIFDAPEYWLQTRNIFYLGQGFKEAIFTNTTNIIGFSEIIIVCANEHFSNFNWSFSIHSDVDAIAAKTIAFSGETIFDACTAIAEAWETEWWAETNSNKIIIHFGKLQVGNNLAIRANEIVKNFPARRGDDASFGTRFYVYGSTRNLTSDYGQAEQGGATNHISEVRLRLPNGQNYIDAWDNLADEDVVEKLVFFEDVYPKNTDLITEVSTVQRAIDDSSDTFTAYVVEASASPFKESDIIAGETIMIKFTSGVLNGFEFEVAEASEFKNKKFEIMATHVDDGNGGVISTPGGALIPAVDDTFILTGVKLPAERISEAEQKLLEAGKAYAAKNSGDTTLYECSTNPVYCEANKIDLTIGQAVILYHARFGKDGRKSRLQGFEKELFNPHIATYQFGDNTAYSRFGEIKNEIEGVSYNNRLGVNSGNGIYVIAQHDTTLATDFNVNSAKRSDYKYLNRQTGGTVKGNLNVIGDIESKGKIMADTFHNSTFTAGQLGSGYQIKQHTNGQSYMEIDNLLVRREMVLNRLTIAEIKSIGGTILLSLANILVSNVVEFTNSYRCYFDNDKGTINNDFVINDQSICRRWNGQNMKYYWRLITYVGTDYIELSKTDKDGSGLPEIGDEIIQLGNRTDVNRQHAIMLSAYGSDAPSIKQYSNINTYNLTGKEVTAISPEGNKFTGDFTIQSTGKTIEHSISDAVDAIEIGGENLLVKSRLQSGFITSKDGITIGGLDHPDRHDSTYYLINKSKKYLIATVYSKLEVQTGGAGYIFFYDRYKTYLGMQKTWCEGGVSGSTRTESTMYQIPSEAHYYRYSIIHKDLIAKIEYGNKPTDWSPSPADVQGSINDVQGSLDIFKTETNSNFTVQANQIASKVSQTDFNQLGNRVSSAESSIIQNANKITLGVSESKAYVDSQSPCTRVQIDARNLDENTYYPVTIGLPTSSLRIIVSVPFDSGFGSPSWAGDARGFTCHCEWISNGSGWGAASIDRQILTYQRRWVKDNALPIGSIGQLGCSSNEFIYIRGGSKYDFAVYGRNNIAIILRTTPYTVSGQTITTKAEVIAPVVNVDKVLGDANDYADAQDAIIRTETNASLQVLSDKISLKTDKTDFDALGQRVSSAESEISLMPNKITLAVSESNNYTNNAISNIKIGNVNLLTNSATERQGVVVNYGDGGSTAILDNEQFFNNHNGKCAIYFEAYSLSDGYKVDCSLQRYEFEGGTLQVSDTKILSNNWQSFTFVFDKLLDLDYYTNLWICFRGGSAAGNLNDADVFHVRNVCFILGDVAPLNYFPSPNDYFNNSESIINNIDIGSVNLLNGTSGNWENIHFTSSTNIYRCLNLSDIKVTSGDTITLSVIAKDLPSTFVMAVLRFEINGEYTHLGYNQTALENNKQIVVTTIVPELATHLIILFFDMLGGVFDNIKVRNIQLEKGNKPTDWAPSPADMNAYADAKDAELASSLTIDANKITLASNTIELNGLTIAKAIEAEDLKVGSRTGLAALEVSKSGVFYARGVNGSESLTIDSENQSIEIKSEKAEVDIGDIIGGSTLRMSADKGSFSAKGTTSVSSNSTAILSSAGIFANTALQGIFPSSSANYSKASIVGLGVGDVPSSFLSEQFVAGVYGRASNASTGGAFGGYFEQLKVCGLILETEWLDSSYESIKEISKAVTYAINSTDGWRHVRMPANPQKGQTIFFKQWWSGKIRIHPNSGQAMYDNVSRDSYIEVAEGQTVMVTYIGGTSNTWLVGKFGI